ncbi:hypothetical protein MSG28_000406 [Choristoneura fumiferana]|uniref:Uncharacterized protein n=1 Tax=Choristoneura fumiferana TaxID=7141 RepID=A0ACC0K106_CHOFU|nr:hypothetical protein MSG28_000406 [Choristoneura fumiferana]
MQPAAPRPRVKDRASVQPFAESPLAPRADRRGRRCAPPYYNLPRNILINLLRLVPEPRVRVVLLLARAQQFKDGVPYPWPTGRSNLILYPEAANQTLYVRRASAADSGEYTCRVSNQTHTQDHLIKLQILNKLTEAPKTMYVSKDQWVEEGHPLRLFCEAMIGRTFLADARSDLRWRKVWPNDTEGDLLPTQREINISRLIFAPGPKSEGRASEICIDACELRNFDSAIQREDVQNIHGSYLTVGRMSPEDYGKFVCVVHSNNVVSRTYVSVNPPRPAELEWHGNTVPWRALALAAALAAALALSAAALLRRCAPRLRLLARHAQALTATPAQRARVLEKEFDVLVCWTPVDGSLVRGALLPTLQLKYKYRVRGVQLPSDPERWYAELLSECTRSRSLVAVVSPAQHSPAQLLAALRQLRALPLPPVVVLLQDLPNLKREAKDSGETLVSVLRRTRLVPWRHVQDREFWTQLRLALPLPPPQPVSPKEPPSTLADSDDKNSRSGSLTALV